MIHWIEEYLFYNKTFFQKLLSISFLPLSAVYCLVVILKRKFAKPKDLGVKVLSIGNLIIGGSGKTPLTIAIAKQVDKVAIVLRGYGRKSKGLIVLDENTSVFESGDEAKLLFNELKNATIIVSENRVEGILKAKQLGFKAVILDDGFSKVNIKKFDVLIKPKNITNNFCIPSGGYREPKSLYKKANLVLEEDIDFKKNVTIQNPTNKMVLVTAISKPNRLDPFLPKEVVGKVYLKDHSYFNEQQLKEVLEKYNATSILTTQKDFVKMENFNLNISILKLEMEIEKEKLKKLLDFLV